jgi:hypothetical protein
MKEKIQTSLKVIFAIIIMILIMMLFARCTNSYADDYSFNSPLSIGEKILYTFICFLCLNVVFSISTKNKIKRIVITILIFVVILSMWSCTAPQYCHTYKSASYDANHRAYSLKHDMGVNPVFPRRKY